MISESNLERVESTISRLATPSSGDEATAADILAAWLRDWPAEIRRLQRVKEKAKAFYAVTPPRPNIPQLELGPILTRFHAARDALAAELEESK